jgi:hypothetical protein
MQIKIKKTKKCPPFLLYMGMEIPSTNIVMFVPPLAKNGKKYDWSFYLLL